MITLEKTRHTYEDYAALEEGAPYQLIDGELVMSPSPTYLHQSVVWELGTSMRNFVQKRDLGSVVGAPIDVYFSDTETFQPDLVFISNERRARITEVRINGAPDLVVEVLSPSTAYYDLTKKQRVYEAHGVREYWIVDPHDRTAKIYRNTDKGFQLHAEAREEGNVASALLDGFAADLEKLFAL